MDFDERMARHVEGKARGRAALERLADFEVERRDHSAEYWRRPEPPPAPAPQPPQPSVAEVEALRAADWTKFVDGRIEAALAQYHEAASMRPITREVIRGLVAELRKEIAAEVGSLRADVEIAKAHAEHRESGDVIDLPPVLPRRAHA
jgi:hypothetical protein